MTGDTRRKPQDGTPCISLALIAKRNLDPPMERCTPASLSEALRALHTVRLDREKLGAIENLEIVEAIHSLYLQQNKIKTLENLDHLSNLRFLTLAGNQIQKLENLSALRSLQFLDLSDNQIKTLDVGELPQSLRVLHLTGNFCTGNKDYREQVLRALPNLRELDGEQIAGRGEPEQEEGDTDNDSSDEQLEFLSPLNTNKGFFVAVHQELAGRSERRRKNALQEHEARIEEALDLPSLPWAPGHSMPKAETGLWTENEAPQHSEVKPCNSKASGASKGPSSEPQAMPSPTNPGMTKATSTRESPRKASSSPAASKVPPLPGSSKGPPSLGSGKVASTTSTGKVPSSPTPGKTLPSPSQAKVLSAVLRKTSSPISGKVLVSSTSGKAPSAVAGKTLRSPILKKVPSPPALEKVPPAASKGKNSPLPAPERASSSPAARTPTTKPVPGQTASRGPK